MDSLRRGVSPDAAELDVDDAAGAELDGCAGMLLRVDAFVEANRSVEPALQFDVAENVIPSERLLDHHQVVGFQPLQVRPIFQAIRGIGVDHQPDPRKLQAQPFDRSDIIARLNLDLDALIACGQLALDGCDEFLECFFNSDGHAARNFLTYPAEEFPEGNALLFCLGVPECGFDRAFGHVVAANRFEHGPDFGGALEFAPLQEGPDKIAQDVPSGLDRFGGVEGAFTCDAFAPAGDAVRLGFDEQHSPIGDAAETGFKGGDQRHPDFAEGDSLNLQVELPGSRM